MTSNDLRPRLPGLRRGSPTFLDDVQATVTRTYYCRPVPPFGDPAARLLIVGLAPGMHGANAHRAAVHGRPCRRILLYETLHQATVSASKSESTCRPMTISSLIDCRITNAVKCLPPDNKPVGAEINTCNAFLSVRAPLRSHRTSPSCSRSAASRIARSSRPLGWPAGGLSSFAHAARARPGPDFRAARLVPLQPVQHEYGPPDGRRCSPTCSRRPGRYSTKVTVTDSASSIRRQDLPEEQSHASPGRLPNARREAQGDLYVGKGGRPQEARVELLPALASSDDENGGDDVGRRPIVSR